MTEPKWPTVEEAMRRFTVLIEDQAATDMAARDLIVVMRELGRVTALLNAEPAGGEANKPVICVGERTIAKLRNWEAVELSDATLLPADDLMRAAPPPPPTQGEEETVFSVSQLEELRERLSEFRSNGLDASTCLGLIETIAALRHRGSPP